LKLLRLTAKRHEKALKFAYLSIKAKTRPPAKFFISFTAFSAIIEFSFYNINKLSMREKHYGSAVRVAVERTQFEKFSFREGYL
jgi:hypothetical protein